ncbi:hypothetical protein ElyMa_000243500 [Elysia marginata]|uniref:Uncharacterized protein n=1 Tax=Elysia marginata TaxID=1093978 RepID=A0AAV4F247_9GAST|nr:hypothetical protein ElyMa_000243500 [Elysia marginata]
MLLNHLPLQTCSKQLETNSCCSDYDHRTVVWGCRLHDYVNDGDDYNHNDDGDDDDGDDDDDDDDDDIDDDDDDNDDDDDDDDDEDDDDNDRMLCRFELFHPSFQIVSFYNTPM